jgi:hypothetical protein
MSLSLPWVLYSVQTSLRCVSRGHVGQSGIWYLGLAPSGQMSTAQTLGVRSPVSLTWKLEGPMSCQTQAWRDTFFWREEGGNGAIGSLPVTSSLSGCSFSGPSLKIPSYSRSRKTTILQSKAANLRTSSLLLSSGHILKFSESRPH